MRPYKGESLPRFIHLIVILLTVYGRASALPMLKVDCLGPASATRFAVYLHGLENPEQQSREESQNREALTKLAQDERIRIALPQAQICSKGQRCWASKDSEETLLTLRQIQQSLSQCWVHKNPYSIIGFSNGGYFAFKVYKAHQDRAIRSLIAFGSAGEWKKGDKINPLSTFHLVVGSEDIVLAKAKNLEATLAKYLPGFVLKTFAGGHRIDGPILRTLL